MACGYFHCGGTAGHINPAIAVDRSFKEKHPNGDSVVGAAGKWRPDWCPRGLEIRTVEVRAFPGMDLRA
jgi:UDP-N-acetylglucosamine--N-acetylmuramyl-(pentapeptide) pyrophosphoryl-undecaprenol N-acetylglucosamine transferase